MTNYEKIKSMSKEEFINFLSRLQCYHCALCTQICHINNPKQAAICDGRIINWLESKADEK